MPNRPPDHCPHCGTALSPVDPPTVHRCSDCDRLVFYNPTPTARVAVVDGDALLLCEIGVDGVADTWATPGGAVEGSEDPDVAAARELREEAGLVVDPDVLSLFDVTTFEKFPDSYKLRFCYAVSREETSGTLRAGAEPDAVRFWTPDEFAAGPGSLTEHQPGGKRAFDWWLTEAKTAVAGAP